jgi:hypothetical protein
VKKEAIERDPRNASVARDLRATWMRPLVLAAAIALLSACAVVQPRLAAPNHMIGTWRMVSAFIEAQGERTPAYGAHPNGLLVFTADMHYVEVLLDGDLKPFASNARGRGTDEENRRAMAGTIGMFGRYTVDEDGNFSGNVVEGATFPNWIGAVRTTADLRLRVVGDRLFEEFRRPDGTRIAIEFQRVR